MALKAIMLRRSIDKKTEELNNLRAKDAEFATRKPTRQKRNGSRRKLTAWRQS